MGNVVAFPGGASAPGGHLAGLGALAVMRRWLAEYQGIGGRSVRSVESQRRHVEETLTAIAAQAGLGPEDLPLEACSREAIADALLAYRSAPDSRYRTRTVEAPMVRSDETMRRRVSALRTFFGWCVRTDRLLRDPTITITLPRPPRRLPKALSAEEGRAVLEAASAGAWPERDVAILSVALGVGPRLSEMAGLTLPRVVGRPPEALDLLGKGNRERRVWLPPLATGALEAWLEVRAAWMAAGGWSGSSVFVTSRPRRCATPAGKVYWEVGLRPSGLAEIVLGCLQRSGLSGPGRRVHVLRHTFATAALDSEAYNLRELQDTLGHASLATTAVYTKVTEEGLKRAAAGHPLGQRDSRA